jgi:hypothetical protein
MRATAIAVLAIAVLVASVPVASADVPRSLMHYGVSVTGTQDTT